MEKQIGEIFNELSNYIQEVIKNGSDEERKLLPELVNSLIALINVMYS